MNNNFLVILMFLSGVLQGMAQPMSSAKIKEVTLDHLEQGIHDLMELLKLPNDGHFDDQIQANLTKCRDLFQALDFRTEVITTEGAPLLYAEKDFGKHKKSILFYLQIDGQPVDPKEWDQENPFFPVIKEKAPDGSWKTIDWQAVKGTIDADWRVFARSASDSKGPAMAFMTALRIFKEEGLVPDFNIKVIMDFQEELGSPQLAKAVEEHRALLNADMVLIMDGTRHISNWPTLTYGARGIATATLRIFGPVSPLHSGQYGNFAPNPVFEASRLLASMKDEEGKVLIDGFYDGITLTEADKLALNSLPEDQDSLLMRIGMARRDLVGDSYQESLQYPSLNVRGLRAAWTGKEVRTIIPEEVIIEMDLRLVPETPGERMIRLLEAHVRKQGYHLTDSLPTALERKVYPKLASLTYRIGSLPFRTEINSDTGIFLNRAMQRIFANKVVNMRTTGGSQPIAPFVRTLGAPAVSVRIPNPDNSIHAPNENLRLGNYSEGIMMCLAILNEPFN